MTHDRQRLLFLNVGHLLTHFMLLIYPTVALLLERQGAGAYGELLLPSTAGFVAFALGTLPAGWLGDRVGRQPLLVAQFLGGGLGCVGVALFCTTPLQIAAGLAVIGLFAAIYHPVGIPMVAESAPAGRVGRVLGVNGVWGNLGVAAAPLATAVLGEAFGWRAAFLLPGLVALVLGLAFARVPAAPAPSRTAVRTLASAPPRAVMLRVFGFLGVAALFGGLLFSVLTVVLPKAIDAALGQQLASATGAATLAAGIFAVAAFAQLVSGRAIDRRPLRGIMLLLTAGQVLALVLLLGVGGWAVGLAALLLALLVFAEIPVHDAAAAFATAPGWRARLFAVKYVLSLGVSALAVPLVAMLYSPEDGMTWIYVALAGCALVVLLASWLLPRSFGSQPVSTPGTAPASA